MKILAFAATNHKESINKQLIYYVTNLLQAEYLPNAAVDIIDLIDYELPLYRQDREAKAGVPELGKKFYYKIAAADALVISFAEHNSSFTAVYKNLFDWVSRINKKVYQGKPTIIMAASPGGRGGASVLEIIKRAASFSDMNIIATVSVPRFQEHFDAAANVITDAGIKQNIQAALASLTEIAK